MTIVYILTSAGPTSVKPTGVLSIDIADGFADRTNNILNSVEAIEDTAIVEILTATQRVGITGAVLKAALASGGSGGGSTTFIGLTDTPGAFVSGQYARVNPVGNAIIFEPLAAVARTGSFGDLSDTTTVTIQGNSFNSGDQLVQLDSSGRLPAVDGSQLTGLPSGVNNYLALSDTPGSFVADRYPRVNPGGTAITFEALSNVARTGAYGDLSGTPALATVATSGSYLDLSDAPSDITTQGNSFNGNSQLVQLDSSGRLPAVDASLLTGLPSGVSTFVALSDTPGSFTANQYARVNPGGTAIIFEALSNVARTGAYSDLSGAPTNVTTQGNSFNGNGQLVQLDGSGRLPAIDASQLTGLPSGVSTFIALSDTPGSFTANLYARVNPGGTALIFEALSNVARTGAYGDLSGTPSLASVATSGSYLDLSDTPANITTQGNSFNGNSQLVQLDGSGRLPAVDASLLTGLPSGVSTFVALSDTPGSFVADQYARVNPGGTAIIFEALSNVARTGAYGDLSGTPTLATVATSGDYADLSNAPSNITTQGNAFNGNNQLVQLNGTGQLPAIDGSQLTGLPSGVSTFIALSDTTGALVANQYARVNAAGDTIIFEALSNVARTGAYSDLSGAPDTTNASNLASGTVAAARLPQSVQLVVIASPEVQSYPIVFNATRAFNVISIDAQTDSGDVTADIEINGVDVTSIAGVTLDSTLRSYTATGANSVAIGQNVNLNVGAISTPVNLRVNLIIQFT